MCDQEAETVDHLLLQCSFEVLQHCCLAWKRSAGWLVDLFKKAGIQATTLKFRLPCHLRGMVDLASAK
jgi:hypothetical protein